MKIVKSSDWIRLRGQIALNAKDPCKIDTPIFGEERFFIIPETEIEKQFFQQDSTMYITGYLFGPVTHDPDREWGWRFEKEITAEQVMDFSNSIITYMDTFTQLTSDMENLESLIGSSSKKLVTSAITGKSNKLPN